MWAWRFTVPVLVPDLHHHSVQKDHRVERFQRPVLPLSDLVHHGLGDIADGLMGQLSTQPRGEVMLNLTDRHTGPHKGLMIMPSRPPSLRPPVGTNREVNEPLRSPGARPARPPYPRSWGWCRYGSSPNPARPGRVSHSPGARSTQPVSRVPCTALTSSGNNPPSPVKAIPRSLAEANNSSNSRSSISSRRSSPAWLNDSLLLAVLATVNLLQIIPTPLTQTI